MIRTTRNLSISDRLIAGFALIMLLFAFVFAVTRTLLARNDAAQQELTQQVLPRAEAAQELEQAVLYVGIATRAFILLGGAEHENRYRQQVALVRDWRDRVIRSPSVDAQNPLLLRADTLIERYLATADSLVKSYGQFTSSTELALRGSREAALDPVREYAELQRAAVADAFVNIDTIRTQVMRGTMLALVAGLLLATLVAVATVRAIRGPTGQLMFVANALQREDWAPARELRRADTNGTSEARNELVRIGEAFGAAAAALEARDARISEQYDQLQSQHEELQAQHEEIQAQHEELQAQHEEIQAQHEEIQAQNEEIIAQNDQLQGQTAALTEADEQKNRFLGLLAHELRNPMAAIANSSFLLQHAESNTTLVPQARSIIERQTRQLQRLVDDLLDVTRIAHGKLQIERADVDVAPIIANCVSDHRNAASRQQVTIDCVLPETPLYVHGDGARLQQVIGNLLDNAIKFSRRGGHIRVWASVSGDERDLVISVSDDGIGIDPSVQKQLFKPFVQADPSHTRLRGGLGLGLSLVRAYVALHGGSVDVKSDGAGRGSTFTVVLPLLKEHAVSAPVPPARIRPVQPRRILVVEDNPDGADSLHAALRVEGHTVKVASSVDAALAIAEEFAPDVTLCDVGLPEVDGYEFARRIRASNVLCSMRIIALTGYATPEDKQRAEDAGFDHHMTKPASMDTIRALLSV